MVSKGTKAVGVVSGVVLCVGLVAFVGFALILTNLNSEYTDKKILQEQTLFHLHELDSLVKLVTETAEERNQLTQYILKEDSVIDFLTLIENLGKEQGVHFKTNALTIANIDENFEELQIQINIIGPYKSVLHMISLLETLPYQSSISNISLSAAQSELIPNAWDAGLLLRVTKFKEL